MQSTRKANTCPIPGCNYCYATSHKIGWFKHVASLQTHPHWHPETPDAESRAFMFRKEFPSFLPVSGSFTRTVVENTASARAHTEVMKELLRSVDEIRARILAIAERAEPKSNNGLPDGFRVVKESKTGS